MKIYAAAAAALLATAYPGLAQQTAMVIGAPPSNMLRAGTPIELETLTEVTTEGKHLRVGDRVQMDVMEDVKLNGQTVIPVGSHAVGEVETVRNKGMWGQSGGITARVLYVEANGRQIRASGAFDDKGKTGTGGVVAAVAFIPVAGFFVTGTSARIPAKSHVKAFLDEDVPVAFAAGAPVAPMTVAVPAAVPAAVVTPAVAPAAPVPPVKVTPVSAVVPKG